MIMRWFSVTQGVTGNAEVTDKSIVCGNAVIKDNAIVMGKSIIQDSVVVEGDSVIESTNIGARTHISGGMVMMGGYCKETPSLIKNLFSDDILIYNNIVQIGIQTFNAQNYNIIQVILLS